MTEWGIGNQESVVETTPVLLTSSGLECGLVLAFVLRWVASETTLHGSGRFLYRSATSVFGVAFMVL